jgi:hypothetical protein
VHLPGDPPGRPDALAAAGGAAPRRPPTPPTATSSPTPTATTAPSPTGTPAAPPAATRTAPPAGPGAGRPLVDRYVLLQTYEASGAEAAHYDLTAYRPRQFAAGAVLPDRDHGPATVTDAGAFAGWDLLHFANQGVSRTFSGDLVTVTLTRPARLAVVWTNGSWLPAWLQAGWTPAGAVGYDRAGARGTLPVYVRDVPAGDVTLPASGGSPQQLRDAYYLLLAERGGVPSTAPAQRGSPPAQPNATCPPWVHDQYRTTVDGVSYPTWHRQIDPEYWCYFRHEHGSNPARLGDGSWRPAYGRSLPGTGVTENHEGFKGVFFVNPTQPARQYYVTLHFGVVNSAGAACNRFHEFGTAVWRGPPGTGGVLEADVLALGDFGKSVENTSLLPLATAACPTGNSNLGVPAGNSGARELPIYNGSNGAANPVLYEPWRVFVGGSVLGYGNAMSVNTPDVYTVCVDLTCQQTVAVGGKGALRFLNVLGDFGVRAPLAGATGVFYTNPYGTAVTGGPGGVRQFVRPDAAARWAYLGDQHACGAYGDRFDAGYRCTLTPDRGAPLELEASLTMPN